LPSLAL